MIFDVAIGLGGTGHRIAHLLSLLKMKSKFFSIDCEKCSYDNFKHIQVPKFEHLEDYDEKFPSVKKHFKGLKGNLLLITSGGGNLSFCSLNLLGQLQNNFKIYVLYIQPALDMIVGVNAIKQRTVFGVFQESARSGLFGMLYLASNEEIDKCLGRLPLLSYNEKINDTIASTFNTICKLQEIKPVFNTFHVPPIAARIATFGILDPKENEEKMFFDLDRSTDAVYYFGYSEKSLKNDPSILSSVKNIVKSKMPSEINRISYGIYATNYEYDIVYCLKYTSEIQINKDQ